MLDPRTWTLLEADALAVRALRESDDDSTATRPITVRFSGSKVSLEYFQRDMAMTGWEITRLPPVYDETTIEMQWDGTSDDEALRELSARLRDIASSYGIVYEGWSLPPIFGGR
ncbi:ribonuclease E inhibitor RraB [Sphingomonas sp. ZT3P38]|uniref:ribonuclease E inhibitor RraB n=1 Tax=Parasphingomonas zepuensis TaxID=3096161 RepID=UPI002FC5D271